MKRVLVIMTIALLSLGSNYSCSKDESNVDEKITAADMAQIKATVESGDWRISVYSDDDIDETNDYAGFSFTFNSDGTLGATDGNTSVSGAWSITNSDNSNDDSSDDDIDFNIFFTTPDIFEELADDWEIVKFSSTLIELKDVSGGDGSTDYLTFEKN